jgi:DNA primase
MTREREVPWETLEHFGVGYTPEYFDHTERIIIPHFWRGELVGWQARRVNPRDEPKYKNSPDFPRDSTYFSEPLDKNQPVIVVESPLSVLRHYHHVPNMISTFGATVSDHQIRQLAKFPDVVLWFDNDTAGWVSTQNVGERLARFTSVAAVESTWDADPADLVDEEVEYLISLACPTSIWEPPEQELIKP